MEQGRNLEEIDQLFEANLPAWRFDKFETDGLSHDVVALELGKVEVKNIDNLDDDVEERAGVQTTNVQAPAKQ